MKKVAVIILLSMLMALGTAAGRELKPRLAGLEGNAEYMELLMKEHGLLGEEDSLTRVITQVRSNFRNDRENAAKYGAEILKLEGEIFDIRNRIGIVAGKVNSIEQEFIISNLGKMGIGDEQPTASDTTASPAITVHSYANLVNNDFLVQGLSKDDYKTLLDAQSKEQVVANYIEIYGSNYASMVRLAADYKTAQNAEQADSIYAKYESLGRINNVISDSIARVWDYVFDNKLYTYNYLLDKLNKMELLDEFAKKGAQTRDALVQTKGSVMSEALATYGLEKRLILDYEKRLARLNNIDIAVDSLSGAEKKIEAYNYNLKKIDVAERFFIDYEEFQVYNPSKYSAKTPIPKCVVYPRGVIYRVFLGSYTRAQPINAFKGIYPLSYIKDEGGRINYYAAGYESQAKADEALERIKRMGFKGAKVAMWDFGAYTLQSGGDTKDADNTTLYRIEITGAGDDLNSEVKSAIADNSEGREISRVGNSFMIGSFGSFGEAQRVAEAIKAQDRELSVKIVELAP